MSSTWPSNDKVDGMIRKIFLTKLKDDIEEQLRYLSKKEKTSETIKDIRLLLKLKNEINKEVL